MTTCWSWQLIDHVIFLFISFHLEYTFFLIMKTELPDTVKQGVDYIIENENYEIYPEVEVTRGSQDGDGYASKSYAITIKGNKRETINLFVKSLSEVLNPDWKDGCINAFETEFKFYQEVYPTFDRFQEKKNIKEPFNNVTTFYKTNIQNCGAPLIFLQNLRSLGYTLRDRKKPFDEDHLILPLRALARYHALSFAMKDQDPETYQKISNGSVDSFSENFVKYGMKDMLIKCVDQLLESLDPISDQKILVHCKNLSEVLIQHVSNLPQNQDEYTVIGHGDCWTSNMMFLYDNSTGVPVDVKLIDWQCQRVVSPFLDFAYFFYTSATKEFLDNADNYLHLYYNTLSQRITELGSDPEKIYPYEAFLEHWRKLGLFGFTIAFCIVKAQLFEKEEVPDFLNSDEPTVVSFSVVLKHQDKYIKRMKDLAEYFIGKGLL